MTPQLRPSRNWLRVLCAFVLTTGAACIFAADGGVDLRQTQNYSVDFWREADGLPQSRVRNIVQTRDGYLWLGTVGGLLRFDGAKFTQFDVRSGSLRDNEVWAVREDTDGALWIGTVGGGLTRSKDGEFVHFGRADGLPDEVIRHIDFDREGRLWVATLRGAARREGEKFRTFTDKDGLLHSSVTRLCASALDGVFAVAGDQLQRLDGERFVLAEGVLAPADGRPLALSSGRDGALWICCEAGVVKKLLRGRVSTFAVEDRLRARNAFTYEDSHGTIWMGARDGLRRLEHDTFRVFSPRPGRSQLNGVLGLAEDREGSLWLGLETNGLAHIRRAQFFTLDEAEGLAESSLRAVYQAQNGDIWIGTASGAARYRDGQVTNFTTLNGAPLPWVNSFAEDAHGAIWIAAAGDLLVLQGEALVPRPGWKRTTDIKSIFRDAENRMWVTTDGDGVFILDGEKATRLRAADGLASNHVRGLIADRQGAIWITTFGGGVSRYADGKFTTFTEAQGLGSDRVVTAGETDDGALWFATRNGISRLRDGQWRNFTVRDGLPVNFVSAILDDRHGSLWFSSDQGIFRAKIEEFDAVAAGRAPRLKPVAYGVKDGMRSAGFMAGQQPNACRTRDGLLLFPSLRGLVVVDSTRILANTVPPPVHIERVVIDRQPRALGRFARVAPGDGEFQIDYTALSFMAPEKVRFRYRLEGFDDDWVEAETRRFAHYAGLPAGDYTFRVTACNNDGVWNETGATFAFRLEPFFYRTPWFYALCGFVVLALPAAMYGYRVRRLERHERELQQKVAEAVAKVRVLSGMLPICASCKQVRDDKGYWNQIEVYIREHSDTQFSHGICPDCMRKLYPDVAGEVLPPDRPPPQCEHE